jgi:DNA-binding NtrC family response regulator
MAGRIVVVHINRGFLNPLAGALRAHGYDVLTFESVPMARDAINSPEALTALITKVRFPNGGLDGVALAKHARRNHPGARIFFPAGPELQHYIDGLGTLLRTPMRPRDMANIVTSVLADDDRLIIQ